GTSGTVVSLHGKNLMIRTDAGCTKSVDLLSYKTIDYDFATTGHSAQSRTVDSVIVLQTSRHRKEIVNKRSLYVAASRTKSELHLVVDDLRDAALALNREHIKHAALDTFPKSNKIEKTPDPCRALGLALGLNRSRIATNQSSFNPDAQ